MRMLQIILIVLAHNVKTLIQAFSFGALSH